MKLRGFLVQLTRGLQRRMANQRKRFRPSLLSPESTGSLSPGGNGYYPNTSIPEDMAFLESQEIYGFTSGLPPVDGEGDGGGGDGKQKYCIPNP